MCQFEPEINGCEETDRGCVSIHHEHSQTHSPSWSLKRGEGVQLLAAVCHMPRVDRIEVDVLMTVSSECGQPNT